MRLSATDAGPHSYEPLYRYTEETARTLAEQLLDGATSDSSIAVVSTPSVYVALRNILNERRYDIKPRLCLLEYDKRFEVLGTDYVPYVVEVTHEKRTGKATANDKSGTTSSTRFGCLQALRESSIASYATRLSSQTTVRPR